MRTFRNVVASTAVLLMLSAVASAGGKGEASVSRLKETRDSLAARASNQKGYPRARLDMERARVNDLINDLEAGKRVDPSEIDSALRRANEAGR